MVPVRRASDLSTFRQGIWEYLIERPAQLLVASFAIVILVGTALLAVPFAAHHGRLSLVEALFTATSATCVTGLIVVDTGTYLTAYGQWVVLALIQVGGLGIMTISTFIALVLGANLGLKGQFAVQEMIGEHHGRSALRLLKFIVLFTLVAELIGAGILSILFQRAGFAWKEAVYQGVFHSVSAFCNAGFSLFPDSLSRFESDAAIPLVVAALFILGGMGFSVLLGVFNLIVFRRRLLFYPRIVIRVTLLLIVVGTLLIWVFERRLFFAGMSLETALLHSFFQAVTPRTAGFNTCDLGALSTPTVFVIMALMFIGAAPGSTAGGIKVTTLAVFWGVIAAVLRGHDRVVLRNRKIGYRTVLEAVSLVFLAAAAVFLVLVVLLLTQHHLKPLPLMFECFSAFGTVGLSLGITSALSGFGKLCIVGLMFGGRVGLLTLLVMARPRQRFTVDFPMADMMVG